jgi:hypothetical protein
MQLKMKFDPTYDKNVLYRGCNLNVKHSHIQLFTKTFSAKCQLRRWKQHTPLQCHSEVILHSARTRWTASQALLLQKISKVIIALFSATLHTI